MKRWRELNLERLEDRTVLHAPAAHVHVPHEIRHEHIEQVHVEAQRVREAERACIDTLISRPETVKPAHFAGKANRNSHSAGRAVLHGRSLGADRRAVFLDDGVPGVRPLAVDGDSNADRTE